MKSIRNLKVSVLLLGAVALLGLLFWAVQDDRQVRISTQPEVQPDLPDMADMAATTSATAVMKEARYEGEDARGHTWVITAAQAVQQGDVQDSTLHLTDIGASWEGDDTLTLKAGEGLYHQASHTLVLEGGVDVTGKGLTMAMPGAKADITTMGLQSQGGAVKVSGPLGGYDVVLTSNRFEVAEGGQTLIFTGNVHGVLTE